MQPGNLVRVKNMLPSDSGWVVRLYRECTPVLLIAIEAGPGGHRWVTVLDEGRQKFLRKDCLEVVS